MVIADIVFLVFLLTPLLGDGWWVVLGGRWEDVEWEVGGHGSRFDSLNSDHFDPSMMLDDDFDAR